MFGRRNKRRTIQNIREFLWPTMGWQRTFRYVQHRLVRIKDTTGSIARGMAFGAAVSFAPVPGTHIASAAFLSWITRGNILASVIGTLVGNPWTFPFMWWGAYKLGDFVFFALGLPVREMPAEFTWNNLVHEITNDPLELFVPWVCGGFILGALSWPLFYIIFYRIVRQARLRQTQWRVHRLHKEGRKLTEPQKKHGKHK
ncbi:MAG TPA: DUF2062 domain-containing protein [Alphaproteobacteria bacterium]|nr:DUF2062 domain-containing protein [Alphaproteobacteria bacterium]HNS43755.1 DUF2062 domain-containing protein [Alphaproteobacteria bacterium]